MSGECDTVEMATSSPLPALRPRRVTAAVAALAAVALVALVSLVGAPLGTSGAGAQVGSAGAPLGLSAPAWSSLDLPAEMRLASLWVLPGPDGSPSAVDVRFAGPFTPPSGRWRVSVGVGDPAGSWQRVSMVWDGTSATGVAEQIEGLAVAELGVVTATVDPSGSVVVGVPVGVLDAGGAGLVWAEAILGEDTEPTLVVRAPWFPRAVLAGEGAPGLLQGSTLGVPVPAEPGGAAGTSAPSVVDTGVPSVLEFVDGVLRVDPGAAPASGDVVSVVDLVTLVGTPGTLELPPSGPQVRLDLLGGTASLGVGSVLGPLAPPVGDDVVVGPSAAWLRPSSEEASPPAPLEVVVPGAFAEVGQPDPGDGLAVSVTRVLTLADGSQVVAPGVVGDDTWLGVVADVGPVSTAPAQVADTEDAGAPVVPIIVGVVLGVVAVAAAMAIAGARHRRRHPGPDDEWLPPAAATVAASPPATLAGPQPATGPPVVAPADRPGAPPPATPPLAERPTRRAPAERPTRPAPPRRPPVPPPTGTPGEPPLAERPTRPTAPPGPTPPASPAMPGGVEALDDDLDELAERLRRLDDGG